MIIIIPRPASRSRREDSAAPCVEPRHKKFRGHDAVLVWQNSDMDEHPGLRRRNRMSEESEDEAEQIRGRHAPIQNLGTNEGTQYRRCHPTHSPRMKHCSGLE